MAVSRKLSITSVGPAMNTNAATARASTILMLDSHWMPRSMPDTAEKMKAMVKPQMMATRPTLPIASIQPLNSIPAPICNAPRPSDAADPNRVAKMAIILIAWPPMPSARRPRIGRNTEEINCERPRRKVL